MDHTLRVLLVVAVESVAAPIKPRISPAASTIELPIYAIAASIELVGQTGAVLVVSSAGQAVKFIVYNVASTVQPVFDPIPALVEFAFHPVAVIGLSGCTGQCEANRCDKSEGFHNSIPLLLPVRAPALWALNLYNALGADRLTQRRKNFSAQTDAGLQLALPLTA